MTNLDEFQTKWAGQAETPEDQARFKQLLLGAPLQRAASNDFRKSQIAIAFEAVLAFGIVVFLGSFIFEHLDKLSLVIPLMTFDVFMIWTLASQIRHLVYARRIDFSQPVVQVQRDLEAFLNMRLRYAKITFFVWFMAWVWLPFILIGLKDYFELGAPGFPEMKKIVVYATCCAVGTVLCYLLARRFNDRLSAYPKAQKLTRLLAGHYLNRVVESVGTFTDAELDSSNS